MDPTVIIFVLISLLGLAGAGARFIPGWGPDNKVEEAIEQVIQTQTGQIVDLSPDTPDPDNQKNNKVNNSQVNNSQKNKRAK